MNVEVLEFTAEPPPRGNVGWSNRPGVSQMSPVPERFNAIYAVPNTLSGRYIPLVVDIHGGPHEMSTTSFQHRAKVFLKLGFAVLMINYRGSLGNGDRTLQSILGNVAKNELDDVHLAINRTLLQRNELDNKRVVLLGQGFGGYIASYLNMRFPDLYSILVLTNPLTDLAAFSTNSDVPDLAWQLLGLNYTVKSLPVDIGDLAWQKSPLNQVDVMFGRTLIFVGDDDTTVVPESQGIALYKALHHRNTTTALYHYPANGHILNNLEVIMHSISKTFHWVHTHWATYNEMCAIRETTTTSTTTTPRTGTGSTTTVKGGTTGPGGVTTKPPVSSATTSAPMAGQYITGSIVLLCMHIFTLGVWLQFKI